METASGIFEEFDHAELRGLILWVPMLEGDDLMAAQAESASVADARIDQLWDADREVSRAFA